MTDDALDPRDAVLELLLDTGADHARRERLRGVVERDPSAAAELAEFERIDNLLRTAGPMVEPSDDLVARIMAVPDTEQPGGDVPWELATAAEPEVDPDASYEGELVPPDGPTLLADLMPPPTRSRRTYRERNDRGFWRNIVVWRAATVVAAAAAIVLGVLVLTDDDETTGVGGGPQEAAATVTVTQPADTAVAGATIALQPAADEKVTASMVAEPASDAGRRIHITIDGLPKTPNRVYTVWIARAPQRRIALGTFRADDTGRLDVTVTVPKLPAQFKGVWVTREPQTGRKGWSKDWIVKGALS